MARRHREAYRWRLLEVSLGPPHGLCRLIVAEGEESTRRKAQDAADRKKKPDGFYEVEIEKVKKRRG